MKQRLEGGNNMKKKKGFTLIELLAVIVILAIIALIAVPVVMNIINRANKSAFKNSAYGLLKAGELFYTDKLLETAGLMEDKVFTFPNDIEGLEFQGSKPSKGSMTVNKDGKISMTITNGKYCVTKGFEDDDVTITDDVTNCGLLNDESSNGSSSNGGNTSKTLATLATNSTTIEGEETIEVPDCIINKTKCEAGTPVAVEVAPNLVYKFYVLNDDITKNEVTLIMDRNLGEKVGWASKTDYNDDANYGISGNNNKGPITALNYLNSQTKDWGNIPLVEEYTYNNNLNGTTNEYGYQKLEIKNGVGKLISQDGTTITEIIGASRTRLLTYEEYNTIKTNNLNVAPNWIYGNLSEIDGYWLLTADPSNSSCGRRISCDGSVLIGSVDFDAFDGIRPVITLSK